VSQWWEGNIKKTASHLYALLVTSLSTKFLAGQMWLKSDKWQARTAKEGPAVGGHAALQHYS
jgi:hypothetical protein